jgi:hypothetical protein
MTDVRPCALDRVRVKTDQWSVSSRHQIARNLIVGLSLEVIISSSAPLGFGDLLVCTAHAAQGPQQGAERPLDQYEQKESFLMRIRDGCVPTTSRI